MKIAMVILLALAACAHTAELASDTDAKIKLVISLAEEKKFAEADEAIESAQAALKKYRYSVLGDAKKVALADRAQSRLALAGALLVERKAEAGKVNWATARDAYHSAGLRCDKMTDLFIDAAAGEIRALFALKDYATARSFAESLIEKFHSANDESGREILASAYMALGKCRLAQATALETRNQKIQAAQEFAEARWAFLHVIAEYFDEDLYLPAAHYFAGLCYDRLKEIESDAATKARREWQTVVDRFAKSEFKELAEKELARGR